MSTYDPTNLFHHFNEEGEQIRDLPGPTNSNDAPAGEENTRPDAVESSSGEDSSGEDTGDESPLYKEDIEIRNQYMRFQTSHFSPPNIRNSELESEYSPSRNFPYDRDFGQRVAYYVWLSRREDEKRERRYGLAARDSRRNFTPEALRVAAAWFGPQNYAWTSPTPTPTPTPTASVPPVRRSARLAEKARVVKKEEDDDNEDNYFTTAAEAPRSSSGEGLKARKPIPRSKKGAVAKKPCKISKKKKKGGKGGKRGKKVKRKVVAAKQPRMQPPPVDSSLRRSTRVRRQPDRFVPG